MSSRTKSDVKKLFEYWCEVCRTADSNDSSGISIPCGIITESFPESFRDENTIQSIPKFAFPCEVKDQGVHSFSFVLTTDTSEFRFGFCRHDTRTKTAMVIITYLPWHDTFFRLLSSLAELKRTESNKEFQTFLNEAYNRGIPDPGGQLKLYYNNGESFFVIKRPAQFQLPSIPHNHNLNLYFNFIQAKEMIAVFAAMLAERRIIFTSAYLDRLSSCVQAASAFLYPMVWQHIFIPVLPMKLKEYLWAPMPYLIGVPESVLETVTPEELDKVVILNCDTRIFESPFDDVRDMPTEIVSQMKKQLSHSSSDLSGDRVSKIFLGALVQLIGGYRDAVEFRDTGKTFNRDKFIESRPSNLRPFLTKMMDLQIFQQFIDERLDMLNAGLGFSDEFEQETVLYAEKMKKRGRNYAFLKNVKDKTNPAVKSAVKSVKESSRGVKTAYKDLKSKFRDLTPPSSTTQNFRSHLTSNSQHDRIDGYSKHRSDRHHSAPSSPVFSKRVDGVNTTMDLINKKTNHHTGHAGFQYASPDLINGVSLRHGQPLATSNSSSHIQSNGFLNSHHQNNHLIASTSISPTISPASSICSSEMNLSQELQNHPLFKTPTVDRSLKPNTCLQNNRTAGVVQTLTSSSSSSSSVSASRTTTPPPRPPPPLTGTQSLQTTPVHSANNKIMKPPNSYYNHPFAPQLIRKTLEIQNQNLQTKPPQIPRTTQLQQQQQQQQPTAQPSSSSSSAAQSSSSTTTSIYDNPPDMQSPPVPPRRQLNNSNSVNSAIATTAAAVHAGINRLERNCWHDFDDSETLRSSSSSNDSSTLSSGSSNTSFFSAMSTISQQTLNDSIGGNETPVPAPRSKKDKESLRSLQPHHLHASSNSSQQSANSSLQCEDSINDLISLDDSNNTSFDLEDFDPLNQNARPLPIVNGHINQMPKTTRTIATTTTASTLPTGMKASSISNPIYSYVTPKHTIHTQMAPPIIQVRPPPLPKSAPPSMPPPDEDYELLRKYGLDQFTLNAAAAAAAAAASSATTPTKQPATTTNNSNTIHVSGGMSNWTTFD